LKSGNILLFFGTHIKYLETQTILGHIGTFSNVECLCAKTKHFPYFAKSKNFFAIINQSPFDSHQVLNIEGHAGIYIVLKRQ
jgi:hypothetical protein